MFGLSPAEMRVFHRLSTPEKIQDFLDALPINMERAGETTLSPRRVLRENHAHCIEGALISAVALWIHGGQPLLLDLKTVKSDDGHVVALFKRNGRFGALGKTNHSVLRYRDPVYRSVRELAYSYFHEYFLPETGAKTLVSYSRPFSLKRYDADWIISEEQLWSLVDDLDESPHFPMVPGTNRRFLRRASRIERVCADIPEWNTREKRHGLKRSRV